MSSLHLMACKTRCSSDLANNTSEEDSTQAMIGATIRYEYSATPRQRSMHKSTYEVDTQIRALGHRKDRGVRLVLIRLVDDETLQIPI